MSASVVAKAKPFAWSYSVLKNFETCPKRYYHYNYRKDVQEPETQQLIDGNNLHNHFSSRLVRGTPLPLGYGMHEKMLAQIAAADGATVVEQKLAVSSTFQPCTYFANDVWFRTVIDAGKIWPERATIFDWKTGKVAEDLTQLQLMAVTLFIHQPQVQRIKAALMFVNAGKVEPAEFVRDDMTEIWAGILPRVRLIEKAIATQEFPPKPSGLCRKYCIVTSCPYHGRGA